MGGHNFVIQDIMDIKSSLPRYKVPKDKTELTSACIHNYHLINSIITWMAWHMAQVWG